MLLTIKLMIIVYIDNNNKRATNCFKHPKMIGDLLNGVISGYLFSILKEKNGESFTADDIGLGNISQLETGEARDIIVSLVNIEQDTPLRNNPAYSRISDTSIKRHNPYIVLNFYVLFTAYRSNDKNVQDQLNDITNIIAAFQKKNVFTASDLGLSSNGNLQTEKVIFDLYSMTFEQLNHLWGVLGGKYLPSVLYKMRLVSVFVDEDKEPESVIRSIQREEEVLN